MTALDPKQEAFFRALKRLCKEHRVSIWPNSGEWVNFYFYGTRFKRKASFSSKHGFHSRTDELQANLPIEIGKRK